MRIKYEAPEMEIVKFTLNINALTVSNPNDITEDAAKDNPQEGTTGNPFGN